MRGVKRIAGILERLAVVSLPPAVEPDRYEREERKPLLAKFKVEAEDADGNNAAGDRCAGRRFDGGAVQEAVAVDSNGTGAFVGRRSQQCL